MIDKDSYEPDNERTIQVAKPLFYGFTFLAGVAMLGGKNFTGTLLGVAVMSAISFVSAGLAEDLEENWGRFLEIVAISALMLTVFFSAYAAAVLSFM